MYNFVTKIKDSIRDLETKLGSNLGYFYGILAFLLYAIYDFKVRESRQVPTFQLMFYRAISNVIISNIYAKVGKIETVIKSKSVNRLLYTRSLTAVASTFFGIYGFQRANLSEATALNQLVPVITALLGVVILKENYDLAQGLVTLMSAAGVIFIVKPETLFGANNGPVSNNETRFIGNLGVLASATFFAIGIILAKRISGYKINSQVTNLYAGTFLALVSGPGMVIYGLKPLNGGEMQNVFIICMVSFGANYLYLKALSFADAGKVALTSYTEIPFGYLFDILFFGNVPDIFSTVGVILIFSCLFVQIFKKHIVQYMKSTLVPQYKKKSQKMQEQELLAI